MSKYQKLLEKYYDLQDATTKEELIKKYGTDKKCPKCNAILLKSDLKEYKYLCIECDENFYDIEV